jgi:uncharacterized protein YndB with AHSA1/START domain
LQRFAAREASSHWHRQCLQQFMRCNRRLHERPARSLTNCCGLCHCQCAMTQAKAEFHQPLTHRGELDLRLEGECEIRHEMRINAAPASVFSCLTDAARMTAWLSHDVIAEPRRGGRFRLTDFNELWIEGRYLDATRPRSVVFSWGGIEGLRPGQSIVDLTILPEGRGTFVGLRHFCLPQAAVQLHRRLWRRWGLPKLSAVAKGRDPGLSCLREIVDWREQHSYG